MSEITILTANTTVRILHPHPTEDEQGFRRRREAMVIALQQCGSDLTAVVIVQPSGRPVCVVTQMQLPSAP